MAWRERADARAELNRSESELKDSAQERSLRRISIPLYPVRLTLSVVSNQYRQSQCDQLLDLDSAEATDAIIAGEIDVAMFASQLDTSFLQRALGAPGRRLMNVAQAEAIAKTVAGLKHLVLSRGLISLARDIPHSDVDLLASRNNLLVRKDLHPALQYLLLEAMREVHWAPGPFNRLGEFP